MTTQDETAGSGFWNQRRKARLLILIVFFLMVFLVSTFQKVFLPLVLAFILAYLLDPLVHGLQKHGIKRGVSVGLVFFVFLVLAAGFLWWLAGEAVQLWFAAIGRDGQPGFLADIQVKVEALWAQIFPVTEEIEKRMIEEPAGFGDFLSKIGQALGQLSTQLGKGFSGVATFLGLFILVPIYLFYLLLDFPGILSWMRARLPASQKNRLLAVGGRIDKGLAAFLRGRLLIALLKGLVYAVGLWIVGLPHAFIIGMGTGLFSIIPYVGSGLGFSVATILAIQDPGWGLLIGVLVVFGIAEVIENYILYPWIMQAGVDIGPVLTLFSLLFWGTIFGVFGLILAIPLTIIVREIASAYLMPALDLLAEPEKQGEEVGEE
jgi:predicted PurR-regulated permease PerM